MDVLSRLRSLGGAARYHQLQVSRYHLRRLVDAGMVEQPAVGCYSLPGTPPENVAAARIEGTVSCVSALRQFEVMTYGPPDVVHVSVPANRGTRRSLPDGVVRHFENIPRVEGQPSTTLLAAAVRAASCLPYDQAVATMDQVLRRAAEFGVQDAQEKLVRAVAMSDPRLAAALQVDLDPRARALRESECRLVLRRAGLSTMPAVELPLIGEVDLLVEGFVVIEIDGFEYHKERQAFRVDRRRDRAAGSLGLVVLRFAWEDSEPLAVLEAVQDRLQGVAGPLPSAASVPEWARDRLEQIREAAREPGASACGSPLLGRRSRRGVVAVSGPSL